MDTVDQQHLHHLLHVSGEQTPVCSDVLFIPCGVFPHWYRSLRVPYHRSEGSDHAVANSRAVDDLDGDRLAPLHQPFAPGLDLTETRSQTCLNGAPPPPPRLSTLAVDVFGTRGSWCSTQVMMAGVENTFKITCITTKLRSRSIRSY